LVGQPPFKAKTQLESVRRIVAADLRCPSTMNSEAADLVTKLLCCRSSQRLSLPEALKHDFVKQNHKPEVANPPGANLLSSIEGLNSPEKNTSAAQAKEDTVSFEPRGRRKPEEVPAAKEQSGCQTGEQMETTRTDNSRLRSLTPPDASESTRLGTRRCPQPVSNFGEEAPSWRQQSSCTSSRAAWAAGCSTRLRSLTPPKSRNTKTTPCSRGNDELAATAPVFGSPVFGSGSEESGPMLLPELNGLSGAQLQEKAIDVTSRTPRMAVKGR